MDFIRFNRKNNFLFARVRAYIVIAAGLLLLPSVSPAAPLSFAQASADLKSGDLKRQYAAIVAMKTFTAADAVPQLTNALATQYDPQFRAAILDSLTTLGDPAAVPAIAPLLIDRNDFVRQRAAYAIGLLGGPNAEMALLIGLSKEKTLHVRTTELQGLSLCGSTKSLAILQIALRDPSTAVRAHAIQALRRIPGKQTTQALQQAAEKDPKLKKLIQEALQEKSKGAQ